MEFEYGMSENSLLVGNTQAKGSTIQRPGSELYIVHNVVCCLLQDDS
jgi:hypothetical protein